MTSDDKIILTGGAGLVGQNLALLLEERGYRNLVVLDKHRANLEVCKRIHPGLAAEYADLAEHGEWERHFEHAAAVVMLQAQIGGLDAKAFTRNNLTSTRLVLNAIRHNNVPYLVHVSSSAVESAAHDSYARTKAEQERLVLESGVSCVVLRPTLMFGWFDRKHLGWLSRLMKKLPLFPVPSDGRYSRQPLYAGDLCNIIVSCLEQRVAGKVFNISGLEKIDYIDIMRAIRRATGVKTPLVCIPYPLFYALLALWAIFDRDPPFTVRQLQALAAHDRFEVIDWPAIFGVTPTPFAQALERTFGHPVHGKVELEF
jgi:nucleoside-diphosphate-sugar epimerase